MSRWIGLKILEQWHIIIDIIIIYFNIVFNCVIIVCSDKLSNHSELVLILWVENCYRLIFIVIVFIIALVSAFPDECDIIVIFNYIFFLVKIFFRRVLHPVCHREESSRNLRGNQASISFRRSSTLLKVVVLSAVNYARHFVSIERHFLHTK